MAGKSQTTNGDRARGALEHVEWLARENRHTTHADPWTVFAVQRGWVIPTPGIMSDTRMFRVILTDSGCAAVKEAAHVI